MALSGLGPALSGAYASVQRLLLERKLQQEDLERRQQEYDRRQQAQWGEEMRRIMLQRQWAEEAKAAEARTPEARLARAMQVGPHIPGGVDIADILREMGFPIPPRQVEQGVATVGMPPPGMEGLEAPRPGQILPQQRIAFGGVREEPGRVMVGPKKPRRTYGEAFPAEDLKPGWAAMAIPIDAQGNERPDENARVERPKPADILAREKHVLETTETPQKVYKRGYDRVDALAKAARGASTPEEARGAAVAHNTQLAATNRELKRQGLTELPFKPINIQAAMQGVARRERSGADIVSGLILKDQIVEQRAARAELAKARADLADSTGRVASLQKSGAVAGRLGPSMQDPTAPSPSARDKALDQALSNQAAAQSRIGVARERLDAAGATRPAPAGGKPVAGKKTVTAAQLKAYADTYFKGDIAAAKKRAVAEGYTVIP